VSVCVQRLLTVPVRDAPPSRSLIPRGPISSRSSPPPSDHVIAPGTLSLWLADPFRTFVLVKNPLFRPSIDKIRPLTQDPFASPIGLVARGSPPKPLTSGHRFSQNLCHLFFPCQPPVLQIPLFARNKLCFDVYIAQTGFGPSFLVLGDVSTYLLNRSGGRLLTPIPCAASSSRFVVHGNIFQSGRPLQSVLFFRSPVYFPVGPNPPFLPLFPWYRR